MEALMFSSNALAKLNFRSHTPQGLLLLSPCYMRFPPRYFSLTKTEINLIRGKDARRTVVKSNLTHEADVGIEFDTDMPGIQQLRSFEIVHVKFQLQKDCMYGERFLLVGDHPVIGSWDPMNAIALSWSDGNVWSVEMDLPVDTTMQYKFILSGSDGEQVWQPGSDRILKTPKNINTIIVTEDWENAEEQKITEVSNQLEELSFGQENNKGIEHATKESEETGSYRKVQGDQGMNQFEELTIEQNFALVCASNASFNQGLVNSPDNRRIESEEHVETQKAKDQMKNNSHDENRKAREEQEEEDVKSMTSYQEGSARLDDLFPAKAESTEKAASQELGSSITDVTIGNDERTTDFTPDNFST